MPSSEWAFLRRATRPPTFLPPRYSSLSAPSSFSSSPFSCLPVLRVSSQFIRATAKAAAGVAMSSSEVGFSSGAMPPHLFAAAFLLSKRIVPTTDAIFSLLIIKT